MKKQTIRIVTLSFISLSLTICAYAGEPLPNPAGTLSDAKIVLCDGSKRDTIEEKYIDAVFNVKGVNGFGGHSFSLPKNNQFKIKCAVLSVYASESELLDVRGQIGETLDGMLVEYIAADAGSAQ